MPSSSRPAPPLLPKLITVLREGYSLRDLRTDAQAGLTVAIIALPLSMAIAIASGVGPERGLFTTIIGGFLVSALGGSRFQIGGPAGAFIVLVSACVQAIGLQGLLLATFMSGILLAIAGVLRLGSYIKFIPYPVTVGFTAGIGVIIFSSQIKELLGLTLPGAEPSAILPKLEMLWQARDSANPAAVAVALTTIGGIAVLKRYRPKWPGLLIALVTATLLAHLGGLPVATVADKFGALPRMLPAPELPPFDPALIRAALPFALSFTLLGAITALLSAVVADGISGTSHRSAIELVAQGLANMAVALFGGICVTGAVARSVTNVRSGSRGPVSGMIHALMVFAFLVIAGPLAGYVPLAAFAGLLAVVSWNMIGKEEIWSLIRSSRGDAMVVVVTLLMVVFRDLIEGIVLGFAMGGLVFIRSMADAAEVEPADDTRQPQTEQGGNRVVYRLHGPFFFGAAARLGTVLESIAARPRAFVVDFSDVPFIDSSGARSFELLARKCARQGGQLYLTGTHAEVRRVLLAQGAREPLVRYLPDLESVDEALAKGG